MKICCSEKKQFGELIACLKSEGLSVTKTKKDLIKIFLDTKKPLSYIELSEKIPTVNESTIFRNLKQLAEIGILSEINLDEGFKRYDLKPKGHHHHYVKCTECGKIDYITKCNLSAFEKELAGLGYKEITHQVEFFARCINC